MGVSVLVCDDDKKMVEHIVKTIKCMKSIDSIKSAENGIQAIQFSKQNKFDVLITDIDMPYKNGIDTAKEILKINSDIYIIFVTESKEYALDAFNIYSFDYILKPLKQERLIKTLNKLITAVNNKNTREKNATDCGKFIFNKSSTRYIVDFHDIIMFEKAGRITKLYTHDAILDFYESFNDIEKRLTDNFIRSHRSYIINADKVSKIVSYNKTSYKVRFFNIQSEACLSKNKEIAFLNKFNRVNTIERT